jgi:hypothetical protein
MPRTAALGVARIGFAALAALAVSAQLLKGLDREGFSVLNFFSFFTIQSNLLAVVALTLTGVRVLRGRPADAVLLRTLATFCMVTTGIVYVLLLRGLEESLQTPVPWINAVLHYVMPVVLLVDWLVDPPRPAPTMQRALLVLLYPIAWVTYSLIRGPIAEWYPYPFLDVRDKGYPAVLVTCAVLALAMIGLLWVLVRLVRLGRLGSRTGGPATEGQRPVSDPSSNQSESSR